MSLSEISAKLLIITGNNRKDDYWRGTVVADKVVGIGQSWRGTWKRRTKVIATANLTTAGPHYLQKSCTALK